MLRDRLTADNSNTQVNTIAADTQPVQNLRVLQKVAELGGDKTEWANHVSLLPECAVSQILTIAPQIQWITTNFRSLESLLVRHAGKYCVGDNVTLADVCLVPQVCLARAHCRYFHRSTHLSSNRCSMPFVSVLT